MWKHSLVFVSSKPNTFFQSREKSMDNIVLCFNNGFHLWPNGNHVKLWMFTRSFYFSPVFLLACTGIWFSFVLLMIVLWTTFWNCRDHQRSIEMAVEPQSAQESHMTFCFFVIPLLQHSELNVSDGLLFNNQCGFN